MDDTGSEADYEPETDGNHHSRQRASPDAPHALGLTRWASSPGILAASISSSPTSLQRQNTLPKERVTIQPSSSSTALAAPVEASPRKAAVNFNHQGSLSSQTGSRASRRLSRTIHIPVRASRSGQSSRSTSRSRSPLPGSSHHHHSLSGNASSASPNRRSSRILVDDPVDPIMTTLYEIIGVATDITEMSISQLTAQPKICSQLVQRVQQIGKAWDEHPDWHGRNWYVQVLLAVASLSRVVEWWEAEKQFWNFDDDDDDEEQEPFAFLLKPADEPVTTPAPTPTTMQGVESDSNKQLALIPDDENRLRLSRTPSHPGQSRDEMRRSSATLPKETDFNRPPAKPMDTTESARVLATERLRLQAEQAQNQNIVIELSVDGDHLLWISHAWSTVVG